MTTKSKKKPKQGINKPGIFARLFSRPFVIKTTLDVDACVYTIKGLDKEKYPRIYEVKFATEESPWQFQISHYKKSPWRDTEYVMVATDENSPFKEWRGETTSREFGGQIEHYLEGEIIQENNMTISIITGRVYMIQFLQILAMPFLFWIVFIPCTVLTDFIPNQFVLTVSAVIIPCLLFYVPEFFIQNNALLKTLQEQINLAEKAIDTHNEETKTY